MDDVRGLFLRMPHGTTPAAVTTNKTIIMSPFKSSGDIQKEEGGPDSCSDNQSSSVTLSKLANKANLKICEVTFRGLLCLSSSNNLCATHTTTILTGFLANKKVALDLY